MFTLPDLPYGYNALEPYIDEQTMRLHYGKHHQAYVDNLNKALESLPANWRGHDDLLNLSIEDLLQKLDEVPQDLRTKVRNNGGGHYNHTLFWEIMAPNAGGQPSGALLEAIKKDFGDLSSFKEKFTAAATRRFGSGWAWLILEEGKLVISDTPNQDSPIMQGITPILGLDVWEHAYYLKYQNRRPEYIENWWNVVNWKKVEKWFSSI